MSKRFGRKQRRQAIEQRKQLEYALRGKDRLQSAVMDLQRQLRSGGEADRLLVEARSKIQSAVPQAIIEAENEFLRDALAQLRRAGGDGMELMAVRRGPSLISSDEAIMVTVIIPEVRRSFLVGIERDRRRA